MPGTGKNCRRAWAEGGVAGLCLTRRVPDQARARCYAGAASRSFTSTAVHVVTSNARQMVRVERTPKAKVGSRLRALRLFWLLLNSCRPLRRLCLIPPPPAHSLESDKNG